MEYFKNQFNTQEPKYLIKLLSKVSTFRYGMWEIDKPKLIGELSITSEGEIETLQTEIMEMIQFYYSVKKISNNAYDSLPLSEEVNDVHFAFAIQEIDKINDL
jgi:hypothetical protein